MATPTAYESKGFFYFMELREYQIKLTNELAQKLYQGKRKVIAQLATGGGKTICFSAISKRFIDKNNTDVLILVHRKELLKQTRRTLDNAFGINAQIIIAGMKHIPKSRIYVGMVETVKRRINLLQNIGLVIIDEAHIANFNKLHENFTDAYFIGFTATPLAASTEKPLKNYYDDIVCGIDIPDLIEMGSLCQNLTYAAKDVVNRKSIAVVKGEFDTTLMAIEFSKPKYIQNTIKVYKEKADNTKAVVFNVNIEHSKEVTNAFIEAGYKAKHLDGETPQQERDEILSWFEDTDNSILCNVGIATTGFDEPTIETIIVNRATMSMPLWLQMCGRGARPLPYKTTFKILDLGGNITPHGEWCQSRDWKDIFWNPPTKNKGEGVAPTKVCPQCDYAMHTRCVSCPECGYVFEKMPDPIEVVMQDFVLATQKINIKKIIEDTKMNKEYRSMYLIAEKVAYNAFDNNKELNEEKFNFILQEYFLLIADWYKEKTKKMKKSDVLFAKNILIDKLKLKYKQWNP